jgi:sugar lactone lactonase YvrE
VTSRSSNEVEGSRLWLINRAGEKRVVDADLKQATGVAFTSDQRFLCVTDGSTRLVYSYLIQPDGSLIDKQRYYYLHVDTVDSSGADGMCMDRDGRVYVATQMGIQVCERSGQTLCIIPTPNGKVSGLCFGGPQFDTLCATCGDMVFQRKLRVHGIVENPSLSFQMGSQPIQVHRMRERSGCAFSIPIQFCGFIHRYLKIEEYQQ